MSSLLALLRLLLLACAVPLGAGLFVVLSPLLLVAFTVHRLCSAIEYFRAARKGAKKRPASKLKSLLNAYQNFQKQHKKALD